MTENSQIILSVCIPTYNRSAKLANCLESVLKSIEGYEDIIEVVISDNCSSDDTSSTVARFTRLLKPLIYIRQQSNCGAEENFWRLWKAARGEYVWIVGDDDRIDPRAVQEIFTKAAAGYAALVLNYSRWSADFAVCQKSHVLGRAEELLHSSEALMRRFGPDLSFISIVVLRSDLLRRISHEKYLDLAPTGFSFLYAVYLSLIGGHRVLLLPASLVSNRNVVSASYDWDSYFIEGIAKVLDELRQCGYSNSVIRSAKEKVLARYIVPKLKARRLAGEDVKRLLAKLISHYSACWRLWAYVIPLVYAPTAPLRLTSWARNYLRRG